MRYSKVMMPFLYEGDGTGSGGDGSGSDSRLAGAALQSALEKERKLRKQLEKQVKDMADKLAAGEETAKKQTATATEQLAAKVAELERANAEREAQIAENARMNRVRRAAKDFANPEDAVGLLIAAGTLADIEDDTDADNAVKALAGERPYLLREKQERQQIPDLEQVLKGGQQQNGEQQNGAPATVLPREALVKMSPEELKALKQRDPALYHRTMQGLINEAESRVIATTVA